MDSNSYFYPYLIHRYIGGRSRGNVKEMEGNLDINHSRCRGVCDIYNIKRYGECGVGHLIVAAESFENPRVRRMWGRCVVTVDDGERSKFEMIACQRI